MTVRVAVIGCGAIARRVHLPAFKAAGAEIVVFASRSSGSAEAASAEWGGGEITDDWRVVLDRDDVDAVDICTPNRLHAEMATAAAAAGKHVLVEKPMATTVEDADRMLAAADAAGVVLMPAHNLRFAPPLVATREAVATGRIGAVVSFRSAFGHGGPEGWAPDATWFRNPEEAGGGALLDLGVHMADLVRAVVADEVTEVAALLSGGRPGSEDTAACVLRFASGATGTLQASWVAQSGPDLQLTVFGTTGTLHVDGRTPPTLHPAVGEPERLTVATVADNPCAAFVRTVETGGDPAVTAADGRAAVAMVCAAYRSAASREVERLA
jgi:predicted dehydrogenase